MSEKHTAEWLIVAPDGWRMTAEKPISLILQACGHERKLNPNEAERQDARLLAAIEDERRQYEDDMNKLVTRFLSWTLPDSVCTDGQTHRPKAQRSTSICPTGTNLLTAIEARAMLDHVLGCEAGDRIASRALATNPEQSA